MLYAFVSGWWQRLTCARRAAHVERGRYATIAFNREIYNLYELKCELGARGHRFVIPSDTDVILAAWRK
jgi:asparagine synthetase B (glutamine-hydrolysing)